MILDLIENANLYFECDEQTQFLDISVLVATRARPEGIARAAVLMLKAANGLTPKRRPLRVVQTTEGKYHILDGNSTYAVAKAFDWKQLPVEITNPGPT